MLYHLMAHNRDGRDTTAPCTHRYYVSLRAIDQNGSLLPYCGEAVQLSVDGPLKIIGPSVVPLRGGMAGTYLATTGEAGRAVLHCRMEGALDTDAVVTIRCREA